MAKICNLDLNHLTSIMPSLSGIEMEGFLTVSTNNPFS